jgi:hypothetical protein
MHNDTKEADITDIEQEAEKGTCDKAEKCTRIVLATYCSIVFRIKMLDEYIMSRQRSNVQNHALVNEKS